MTRCSCSFQAESLGIPLCTLNEESKLDVAIDGADEVDKDLMLVKGGGGALLREKMVEVMADKFIVIVDESKLCAGLGKYVPVVASLATDSALPRRACLKENCLRQAQDFHYLLRSLPSATSTQCASLESFLL